MIETIAIYLLLYGLLLLAFLAGILVGEHDEEDA